MIRALLKKQLLELGAAFVRSSKTGKRRSRAGVFGYALLFIVLMLLVMLSFGAMALPMALTLVPQGLDWLYFVLMELSALTVSVLASAFTSYGHLFRCRDNQQLLALPIPPGAIFAVRCGKALAKPYLRLLTLEPGKIKAEYRAKAQKKQPPHRALLRRELLHLGACPMWLLNCALSSLLLPMLGAAALWKAADLRAFTAAYPPESLPMLVCGMVCTAAAMNFITAPSVSLEGDTLWLLQSLPVTPQQVLRAKVELQLLLTLPAAWLCAGCAMAALRIPAGQGLPVLAVLAAFVWLTAQLGLALGLCLPNLHWVSEAAVVKRSAASMLAMFGGWLLAGGVLFLPLTLLDYAVPPLAAQTVCLAVLLGLDLLLHRWLCTRGAARFAALH